MAIEHLSDEQLASIRDHARRRTKRYIKMREELSAAIMQNYRNDMEALIEQMRRERTEKRDAD